MKFYKMKKDGGGYCVFPEKSLDVLLDDLRYSEVGDTYNVEIIEMAQEEFDKLPEFDGEY